MYYYHTPKKFLVLTDSLDVGKPDAEKSHKYRVQGSPDRARQQTDTGGYEGNYAQKKEEVPSWQNGAMPAMFRDTEFEIPAAMTKGRKKLEIRMVTRNSLAVNASDEKLTNEYYYWIYSYVRGIAPLAF